MITRLCRSPGPEAGAIRDFDLYGVPLTLSGEYVASLDWDLPGEIGRVARESNVTGLSLGRADQRAVRAQLILRSGAEVLGRRGVDLAYVGRGPAGGAHQRLEDRDGVFSLQLRQEPLLPDGSVQLLAEDGLVLEIHVPKDAAPADALPSLEFLALLAQADSLEVTAPGRPAVRGKLRSGDILTALIAARDQVAALAFVQEQTSSEFPVPEHLTDDDLFTLMLTEALLRHGEVPVAWPGVVLPLPVPPVRRLLNQEALLPRVNWSATLNSTFHVAGYPIQLPMELEMVATDLLVANAAQVRRVLGQRSWCGVRVLLVADERTRSVFRWRNSG